MKKLLTLMLALSLALFSIPMESVRAEEGDDETDGYVLDTAFYETLMGQDTGKYLTTCQPDTAILIGQNVTADDDGKYPDGYVPESSITLLGTGDVRSTHASPNEVDGKAIYQLPRLQQDYHYIVEDRSTGWAITEDLYPKLIRCSDTLRVNVLIVSHQTGNTLYTIHVTDDGTAAKASNGDINVEFTGFKDMIENGAFVSRGNVELYNAELQNTSIIMPQYIYSSEASFDYAWSPLDLKSNAIQFYCQPLNASGTVTSYDVKLYNNGQLFSGTHKSLLFGGTKYTDCTYNNNTGQVTTVTRESDEFPLWYFIAVDQNLYVGKIIDEVSYDDEWGRLADDAEEVSWRADAYMTVPHLQEWGPISYDKFFQVSGKYFDVMSGRYQFAHKNYAEQKVNLFAQSLLYAGVIPHVATATLVPKPNTLTINYYIYRPDSTEVTLWKSVDYERTTFTDDQVESPPAFENYNAEKWYSDPQCTRLQSFNNLPSGNSTLNVYTKYDWVGGEYTVNFYNDHLSQSVAQTFKANEQPTLPTSVAGYGGYRFKNWLIVASEDATTGTIYNPSNFTPEAGQTYVFKTTWEIQGIITQVICADKNFDIGTEITKSMLQVYVQESDSPATRIIGDDEYTLSENIVKKEGVNQFVVTYTATGAIAVCEVNGVVVTPTGITAEYRYKDPRPVGTELNESDFTVMQFYSNNTSKAVTEGYAIEPRVLTEIGKQTITVTYAEQETKCYIDVVEASTPPEQKVLESITAAYTGGVVYVNEKLKANSIYVVGTYTDKSMSVIPWDQVSYTPDSWATVGDQQLTVTYGGQQARCTVTVIAKDSGGTNPNPNPTPSPSPSPEPTPPTPPSPPSGTTGTPVIPSGGGGGGGNSGGGSSNTKPGESPAPTNPNEAVTQLSTLTEAVPKDWHLASPGYIRGSTVMTSVLTGTTYVSEEDEYDIFEMISNMEDDQKSLYVKLVNGATTNILTSETLEVMKERELVLTVDMLQSTDHSYTLARWVVDGKGIELTSRMVDLNVIFNVDDTKESDKQVMMSVASGTYPNATQLTIYPPLDAFPSGATVRLYTCSSAKKGAKLVKTFQWSDVMNTVTLNVAENWYCVLSDAMSPYPDGGDLALEIDSKVQMSNDDDDDEEVYIGGNPDEGDNDFWNTPNEQNQPSQPTAKPLFTPFTIAMIGCGALAVVGLLGGLTIFLMKRKTPKGPKPSKQPKQPKQPKKPKNAKGPKGIPTGPEGVPSGPGTQAGVNEDGIFDAEPDESDAMFDDEDEFFDVED